MAVDLKEMEELHWKHHLLGSIEVGIIVLNRRFEVMIWNEFMENHSGVLPSAIKDKVLFEFFPEINEDWFRRKADTVFTLNTPSYVIYEQRPYLFKFPSRIFKFVQMRYTRSSMNDATFVCRENHPSCRMTIPSFSTSARMIKWSWFHDSHVTSLT